MPPHSAGKRPQTPKRRAVWPKIFEWRDLRSGAMCISKKKEDKEEGRILGFCFYGLWDGFVFCFYGLWISPHISHPARTFSTKI
ncbi:hypothetical protein HanRHA438_Chr16g0776871 [Helianthus annuus]|nr:hypothetical protein HanRHA438_Chr16g0776871 [Helianthus annuus]